MGEPTYIRTISILHLSLVGPAKMWPCPQQDETMIGTYVGEILMEETYTYLQAKKNGGQKMGLLKKY